MDQEKEKRVFEHSDKSPISKIRLLVEDILKTDIISVGVISPNASTMEPATFKPLIIAPERQSKDMTLKDNDVKSLEHSKTSSPSTLKSSPKLLMNLTKSMFGIEELLESVNIQTEETEEMLDMILRAKEKLEFFVSHVECLLKSLTKNSTTNNTRGNTYVKIMYRKKLEEFASCLLGKVKRSINYLAVEHDTLKELENKLAETCEKISESNQISNSIENGKRTELNETVDQLLEEIRSLKSKQLSEIGKVSYIETDIEMLYELYRRFSSIEGSNSINVFNFM